MSLLLEALKKAEKAKEEAQRRARGETLEPKTAAPAVQASEARTPLEIVADGAQAKRAEPALRRSRGPKAKSPSAPQRARYSRRNSRNRTHGCRSSLRLARLECSLWAR